LPIFTQQDLPTNCPQSHEDSHLDTLEIKDVIGHRDGFECDAMVNDKVTTSKLHTLVLEPSQHALPAIEGRSAVPKKPAAESRDAASMLA
jgi:hypothetical protein